MVKICDIQNQDLLDTIFYPVVFTIKKQVNNQRLIDVKMNRTQRLNRIVIMIYLL
jgi:hypothetical protein